MGLREKIGLLAGVIRRRLIGGNRQDGPEGVPEDVPEEGIAWGYDGAQGPEQWGSLCPGWSQCAQGSAQSPVDIPASAPVNAGGLQFRYVPGPLRIVNTGRTVQVDWEPGSVLEAEGERYELVQFHFHAHSEHTIDGAYADVELHLVHANRAGELVVVGVFLEASPQGAEENPAFRLLWAHLPPEPGPPRAVPGVTFDPAELLPGSRAYWRYDGSLTTPPCTEGVKWFLLQEPVRLSQEQIDRFTRLYDNNYRPLQPLNDRQFLSSAGG